MFFGVQSLWAQYTELPRLSAHTDTVQVEKEIRRVKSTELLYPDSAATEYKKLYYVSNKAGYQAGKINTLFYLGNISLRKGNYHEAIRYFETGIRLCDPKAHKKMLTIMHMNLANAYNNLSDFEKSYRLYSVAAGYASGDSNYLSIIYGNAATVLGQLNQYQKAMSYLDKALSYCNGPGFYDVRSVLLTNKGRCYYELNDFKLSAVYLDSSVLLSRQHKLSLSLRAGLVESARLDIAKGEAGKALPKLEEAIGLSDLPGMPVNKAFEALSTIGDAYLQLKDFEKAKKYLALAWETVPSEEKERLFIAERLSVLYAQTGRYKNAYELQREYIALKDSFKSKEVAVNVNELETKYRTSEKDKEIIAGRLQISNQEKQMAKKNSLIYGIAFIAMFTITLLLWRYFYISQKNRKLKIKQEIDYLKAVMEGEQKERARIATELHDSIVSELTIVKMNLEVAYTATSAERTFQDSLQQLTSAINNVRNTAHNLMPEIVLRYNLPQAVALLCETIQKTGRLEVEFQQYGDFTQLKMSLKQTVYVMVQELLHNIIKHAQASKALVQLSCYNALLTINVEDNGIGMDSSKWHNTPGMGLNNMAKRVNEHKGRMEWAHAGSGDGTNVYIEFDI